MSMENLLSCPPYLANLNDAQLAAVQHSGSNLLVHAGAGSGKTRVVVARILYHILEQNILPANILAVTFTNRAAHEMKERLRYCIDEQETNGILIRTFHAFGAWFLRRYAAIIGLMPDFTIYDDEDSLALLRQAWPGCSKKAKLFLYLITKIKESGIVYSSVLDAFPDIVQPDGFDSEPDLPEVFECYQKALKRSGNVDFVDLLGFPVRIMEQQPEIRKQMQERFRRILVDEFQDSNPLQNYLLYLLLKEPQQEIDSGQHKKQKSQELCIVGDEDQSIYGFRGAQVRHILEFQQKFAPAKVIKLEQNYRSRAPILELANQVIVRNRERLGKNLTTNKLGGQLPQFRLFENCEEEAVFIAQCIRQNPQKHTAILYRTNAQSRTFERVLREWNIPYYLVGNLSFYSREEIKDITAFLKCLANPHDLVSFKRIYNKPSRGLGVRTFGKIQNMMQNTPTLTVGGAMQQLLEAKTLTNRSLKGLEQLYQIFCKFESILQKDEEHDGFLLEELIREIWDCSGLRAYYEEREEEERFLNLEDFIQESKGYGIGKPALTAFLERVELATDTKESEGATNSGIREPVLTTIHNTKGLEFERVFITGLELGIFPRSDALNDWQKMEEEQRLFYVAITRAEEELYLSAAKSRNLYGRRIQLGDISPLLSEIDPKFYENCSPIRNSQPKDILGCKKLSPKILQQMQNRYTQNTKDNTTQNNTTAISEDPFQVGARVEHLDYGLGYVVYRKYSGSVTTLMIKLDDGRPIRVQLEFQSFKLEFLGMGL